MERKKLKTIQRQKQENITNCCFFFARSFFFSAEPLFEQFIFG